MTSPPRREGVVFDVNETLVDLSGLRPVFDELELPTHGLEWWFAALLRDGMALAASGDYRPFADLAGVALDEVMASSGRRASPAAVTSLLDAFAQLSLHVDVAPAIERLAAWGVPLFALTNGGVVTSRRFFERAGLSELVVVHSVESVGLWKPRPEAYRSFARAIGVEERRLVMVASHPWDLHGAKSAGLSTAWVNRERRTFPDVFRRPDLEGVTLDDVVTRLIEFG